MSIQPSRDLSWAALIATLLLASSNSRATNFQARVDELLNADRAFAAAAAQLPLVDGLAPMLAADVIMPAPPGRLVQGKAAVLAALKDNPANADAKLQWYPIRGGISADGAHGFTFGYMQMQPASGPVVPMKYLAYWVHQPEGWRVSAYKRGRRAEGAVTDQLLEPALPKPTGKKVDEDFPASLAAREQEFSDTAQKIGLEAAFARFGSADAVNMGGPKDVGFVLGASNISKAVGAGTPQDSSPVVWSAEQVRVASSGDLGVTFGIIRSNEKPASDQAAAPGFPFFTVWRRDDPGLPWLYVAE